MDNLRSFSAFIFFFFINNYLVYSQVFSNVNTSAGVTVFHDGPAINLGPTPDVMGGIFGSGAAWLDYNKDGFLDLYISRRTVSNLFYHNNGDGTFSEIGASLGLDAPNDDGAGVAIADFNNDGWSDIYVANGEQDKLYKNINGSSFIDVAISAGLNVSNDNRRGTSATWADYDQDGYLDLYVSQHVSKMDFNAPTTQDWLYHNNGNETFTDVSSLLGTDHLIGSGFIGGWTDYDRDGDPDLILINDCPVGPTYRPTRIFRNDGGTNPTQWNFQEVSVSIGVDDCRNGMGIAVGDYNRDGWMDFAYTNIGPVVLFKNNGGTFSDVSDESLVSNQPATLVTWGCSFFDYDHDGWQDLLIAVGKSKFNGFAPNFLFKNNANGVDFTNHSSASLANDPASTRNAISADYDNDGDLDIFSLNYGDTCNLYRNDLSNGNHYISIELEGVVSNKDGIGAYIKLTLPDGSNQYFETRSGSNLGGGDTPYAHFGLADQDEITEVEITWPSGFIQKLFAVQADQHIKVVEGGDQACFQPIDIAYLSNLSGIHKTNAAITCAGVLATSGTATLQSGTSIALKPGFFAEEGCDFHAYIAPCQSSYKAKTKETSAKVSPLNDPSQNLKNRNKELFIAQPNPANDYTAIAFALEEATTLTLEVFDVNGKLIKSILKQNKFNAGYHQVPLYNLSEGIFYISLRSPKFSRQLKLVVIK